MSIQFSHSFDAAQNVTEITPITACVSMANTRPRRGSLSGKRVRSPASAPTRRCLSANAFKHSHDIKCHAATVAPGALFRR